MKKRILFFAKRNLHLHHMLPIHDWLLQHGEGVELAISSPPFTPSGEAKPGQGLPDIVIQELQRDGKTWISEEQAIAWAPHATVLADADFQSLRWEGRIVNVNHGLISKGFYYTRSKTVQRENTAHLICTPGSYHAEMIAPVLKTRVVPTGLVKFDPIGRGELTQSGVRRRYGIPPSDRVVAFAPTFNLDLSAVPVLTDRVADLARREDQWLLVKLHGMAPELWSEMYRLLALLHERVIYVEASEDLTPVLLAADVVISDVSSAFMEAVALDRPVVLVDNPLQTTYFGYDPTNVEYAWRDVGLRTKTARETLAAVERCFQNPEEKAAQRARYGPRLVGPIDGRAAERAGVEILKLLGLAPAGAEFLENQKREQGVSG